MWLPAGSAPPAVARRPLVRGALAEDRRLHLQLEQPVGLVDLEEPAVGDSIAQLACRDQARPAAHRELVGCRHVLVRMQRIAAVLDQVDPLRRVQQEHEQALVPDANRDGVDPRRRVRPADRGKERGALGSPEVARTGLRPQPPAAPTAPAVATGPGGSMSSQPSSAARNESSMRPPLMSKRSKIAVRCPSTVLGDAPICVAISLLPRPSIARRTIWRSRGESVTRSFVSCSRVNTRPPAATARMPSTRRGRGTVLRRKPAAPYRAAAATYW